MRISKCLSKLSLTICTLLMIGATGWAQPTNDDCTTATLVSAYPETLSGTTVDATDSNAGGTPTECHAVPATSGGVWFEVPGTGGTFSATTCGAGTSFDTRLSVYVSGTTPGSCAALTCVTSNDDIGFGGGCTQSNGHSRSKVDWSTVAGSTYYIYLDGFATTTGTYDLFVEETIPAPLTLLRFDGRATETGNYIQWETVSESNTEWHVLERSPDGGTNWREVERVEAAGFSAQLAQYNALDEAVVATMYYRLKTYDYDGSVEVSPIIRVEREDMGFQFQRLAPMPFEDVLEVQLDSDRNAEASVELYDLTGRRLWLERRNLENGANGWSMELADLLPGIYLLVVERGGQRVTERIVKSNTF
ncbi:MAG: T9SS type A sorting domain-containing protein [Bacteroidota bacterium]